MQCSTQTQTTHSISYWYPVSIFREWTNQKLELSVCLLKFWFKEKYHDKTISQLLPTSLSSSPSSLSTPPFVVVVVKFISSRIQQWNSKRNAWLISVSISKHCCILLVVTREAVRLIKLATKVSISPCIFLLFNMCATPINSHCASTDWSD